jgi:hypothetical protein
VTGGLRASSSPSSRKRLIASPVGDEIDAVEDLGGVLARDLGGADQLAFGLIEIGLIAGPGRAQEERERDQDRAEQQNVEWGGRTALPVENAHPHSCSYAPPHA